MAASGGGKVWIGKCSISVFVKSECNFSSKNPKDLTLEKLNNCNRPIHAHLSRFGLRSGVRDDFEADVETEGQLISVRAGIFNYDNKLSVCPFHRDNLGLNWYRPASCMYPSHIGKMKPFRSCNLFISKTLLYEQGHLIPIGSGKFSLPYIATQ